jgi:mono/diheme cytochrome c family protein
VDAPGSLETWYAIEMRSWLLALVLCVACGKNNEPPPPSSGVPGAKPESGPKHTAGLVGTGDDRAKALFGQLCATCHGPDGKGDGAVAKSLPVKPRNYTDPTWQASVTDDQIKEIILRGGKAVGKNEMMPGNPDLVGDPDKLAGLVKIIRAFGPPK